MAHLAQKRRRARPRGKLALPTKQLPANRRETVPTLARICVLLILALGVFPVTALADLPDTESIGPGFPLCQVPVTKAYKIQPPFCPTQIAAMIPAAVPADGCECCGPFGIPPVFAAGNSVVVRQSPEVHQRIAKFLTDLGAYKPLKPTLY
jgi:hypothetical protein